WMCGVGEKLSPCQLGFMPGIVLVNPRVVLPTKEVFAAYKPDYSPDGGMPAQFKDMSALLAYMQASHNALEKPAIIIQPVIGKILEVLQNSATCRASRMSGSGATC